MIRDTLYTIRNTALHRLFFYLLLLLLPTQLGYHFWPEWALVLGRRVDYLSPTLYGTDILIVLTLVSWGWIIRNRIVYKRKFVSSIAYYVLCIFLVIIVNSYFSFHWPITVYYWIKALEYGLLIFYIQKTRPSLYTIHYTLYITVLYSSLIAIAQFWMQHSVGGVFWWLGERTFWASTPGIAQIPISLNLGFSIWDIGLRVRAYGTFPHPNVLGGFLAVMLPMLVSSMVYRVSCIKQRAHKNVSSYTQYCIQNTEYKEHIIHLTLLIITSILGVVALFLTFSRSAWVVGGVGILYSVYRIVYKTKKIFTIHNTQYTILLITCILFIGFGLYLHPSGADESVVVRLALNHSAIQIWESHPWFGVGLGNFVVALPSFLPSKFIYFLQPVHNIYLLVLAEVGMVGVLCIAYCVLCIQKYSIRTTIYTIPLLAILALGLVDHYPLTLQQGQLLFVLIFSLWLKEIIAI